MAKWTDIDHFEGEDAIITIEEEGQDTVTNIQAKISNIEIGGGAQSMDELHLFGGATIGWQKPREKFTVKFDFFTIDTSMSQIAMGTTTGGAGNEIRSSDTQKRYRIIIWFTPSSLHQSSGSVVVPSKSGNQRRMIFCDCYAVDISSTMDAGEVAIKGTINFELTAKDADGYANHFDEYTTSSTTTMTTLSASAHKGTLVWNATTPAWTGSYRT